MKSKHFTLPRILMLGGAVIIIAAALLCVNQQAVAKSSDHGFLGVYLNDDVKIIIKDGKKSEEKSGIYVTIVDDGPADKAGLEDGDIIVEFKGVEVKTPKELRKQIHVTKPGDEVKVVVLREGDQKDFTVTMGEPEDLKIFSWTDDDDFFFAPKKMKCIKVSDCCDRPWLGIEMQKLNPQLGKYFKVKDGEGVLISSVVEDSPAAKAGLKAGDVIVKLDDEKIKDGSDLIDVLEDKEAGDEVELAIVRKGKDKKFTATLDENPKKDCSGFTCGCGKYSPKHFKHFKGLKGLHHMRILEDLDLDDLEESFKDIRIDIDVDFEDLKEEMEKLKQELEELKKELH